MEGDDQSHYRKMQQGVQYPKKRHFKIMTKYIKYVVEASHMFLSIVFICVELRFKFLK